MGGNCDYIVKHEAGVSLDRGRRSPHLPQCRWPLSRLWLSRLSAVRALGAAYHVLCSRLYIVRSKVRVLTKPGPIVCK